MRNKICTKQTYNKSNVSFTTFFKPYFLPWNLSTCQECVLNPSIGVVVNSSTQNKNEPKSKYPKMYKAFQ